MDEQQKRQIKKLWAERDRVTRAMTNDGFFRASVIHNTRTVRAAQAQHLLAPVSSLVLARALTGASLMASFMKGEERVVITASGDGVVRSLYAEAMSIGEVRGYIVNNATPIGDRLGPRGEGLLKVHRVLYGKYEHVMGVVELRRGDVTSDLSHYLTQSEQIPSVFVIDVDYDEHETIRESAGLLIQAMPGARPEHLFAVYDAIDYLDPLTSLIDRGFSTEDILRHVMPGEITVVSSTPVDYFCRCSQEKFTSILLTLGLDEVRSMRNDGHNELVCQYCSSKYHLSDDDFADLEERLQATRN